MTTIIGLLFRRRRGRRRRRLRRRESRLRRRAFLHLRRHVLGGLFLRSRALDALGVSRVVIARGGGSASLDALERASRRRPRRQRIARSQSNRIDSNGARPVASSRRPTRDIVASRRAASRRSHLSRAHLVFVSRRRVEHCGTRHSPPRHEARARGRAASHRARVGGDRRLARARGARGVDARDGRARRRTRRVVDLWTREPRREIRRHETQRRFRGRGRARATRWDRADVDEAPRGARGGEAWTQRGGSGEAADFYEPERQERARDDAGV